MRTSIWAQLVLCVMILALLSGCSGNDPVGTTAPATEPTQETTAPTQPTQATEPEPVSDGKLYYNVDKGTVRTAGLTGLYSVNLSCEGVTKSYWFKDKTVMDKADTMAVFSLGLSSSGVVVDVFPVDTLGYTVKENMTVSFVPGADLVLTDSAGAETSADLAADALVMMAGGDKEAMRMNDVVTVVQNKDQKIVAMYITKRPPIMGMCDHCQTEVEWTPWTNGKSVPASESGHYRLMQNVTMDGQVDITAAVDIVLDLYGYTITGKGLRCIVLNSPTGTLSVMDSSANQTGKITADSNNVNRGVCLWARSGVINLYSGTMDASHIVSTAHGLTVDVVTDGIFNMYGGTILGGHCKVDAEGKNGSGGAVRVRGQFNMYGGTITGGKSDVGGGNVYVEATGSFKMFGGTIEGGTGNAASTPVTGTVEANVTYVEGAVFEKTGGTIEGE